MNMSVYANAVGLICASGDSPHALQENMLAGKSAVTQHIHSAWPEVYLGLVTQALPVIDAPLKFRTRNNQLALAAIQQIHHKILAAIELYGAHRIGVVAGTSTSGISHAEERLKADALQHQHPPEYHYKMQEMSAPADFIQAIYHLKGPCYGVSTACTSGSKAIASAKRLIEIGVCDAVIAGGVDTLCELTVQGFSSLTAVSDELTNPFSVNRKGINIGEAAAFFIISKEKAGARIAGIGESSDAHHISAPDPTGAGAVAAMEAALKDANMNPCEIDYINLHGTATPLNDLMESKAVAKVFGHKTNCSSTKPFTGHTLGAAGALEAGICWQILQNKCFLPPQLWDGQVDSALEPLHFVEMQQATRVDQKVHVVMSNSFAFGGNNLSIILEACDVSSSY